MLKKMFLFIAVIVFASNFTSAQDYKSKIHSLKISLSTKVVGDAVVSTATHSNWNLGYKMPVPSKTGGPTPLSDTFIWPMTVTWVPTGIFSEYDLVSNGVPDIIVQNTTNWGRIHAVCVSAPLGDPTSFPNRRSKYIYSSNYGANWSFISNVPDVRSGFAAISILSDGREIITNHSDPGSSGLQSFRVFVDAFEGLGSFTTLDFGNTGREWPRIQATNSVTAPNKYIVLHSRQSPDSCAWVAGTNLTSPGTLGPSGVFPGSPAEKYKIAKGADGRLGIVYIGDPFIDPLTDGCVYYMESTNGGNSFSAPLKIYNFNLATDSLYAYRGIAITYQGNSPKVVFAVVVSDGTNVYYQDPKNGIKFWCNELPGSDPNRCITIASPNLMGMNFIEVPSEMWDGFTNCCQPTIGASGNVLFTAFQTPFGLRNLQSFVWHGTYDSCSYNCQWITVSSNGGLNWTSSQRITPIDTTVNIKNYSFSSACKNNDTAGITYYANIMMFRDSIPSIYVTNTSDPPCNGQYIFTRVSIPIILGVHNLPGEVPSEYSLKQNYPNPFNPSTIIKFTIPMRSPTKTFGDDKVVLKVFDILGKEIAMLVNERLQPGTYEIPFSINQFSNNQIPSGIYFYSLRADNYTETKKMILIK